MQILDEISKTGSLVTSHVCNIGNKELADTWLRWSFQDKDEADFITLFEYFNRLGDDNLTRNFLRFSKLMGEWLEINGAKVH